MPFRWFRLRTAKTYRLTVSGLGCPNFALTDNGPQLASVFFQGVLRLLEIEAKYTTPCHPQTNAQVDRYSRTIMRQLRVYTAERPKEWDRNLSLLKTAYNTRPPSSTGQAPFIFVSPRRLQTWGSSASSSSVPVRRRRTGEEVWMRIPRPQPYGLWMT